MPKVAPPCLPAEMGTIVEEMDEMQADVALERAEDVLNELASDKPVRKERVSWALQVGGSRRCWGVGGVMG